MDRIVKLLIAQIGFIFLGVILAAIPCFLIMGMDIAKVYVVVSGLFLGSLLLIWYDYRRRGLPCPPPMERLRERGVRDRPGV